MNLGNRSRVQRCLAIILYWLCPAAAIAGYQTCGGQVVPEDLQRCPDGGIPIFHAGAIPAPAAANRNAVQAAPSNEPHVFSPAERQQMLENDRRAGRTESSMNDHRPARHSRRSSTGARPVNPDPYNTGGWNYNTNQPASPIYNPNN